MGRRGLAEIVENPLPKQRSRGDIHKHPPYYVARNYIIHFVVSRTAASSRRQKTFTTCGSRARKARSAGALDRKTCAKKSSESQQAAAHGDFAKGSMP